MYKQWCILNIKSFLLVCLDLCVRMAATHCVPPVGERKWDCGGRVGVCHLENQWRTVPASAHWSDSWTYQLAACMGANACTCTHKDASGPLWACLSCPSETGFHYRINEPNKPIAISWRPQSMDCQWEEAEFSAGKSTNNVLTHKAICSLDETIYRILMLKCQWHALNMIWEYPSVSGDFDCPVREHKKSKKNGIKTCHMQCSSIKYLCIAAICYHSFHLRCMCQIWPTAKFYLACTTILKTYTIRPKPFLL